MKAPHRGRLHGPPPLVAVVEKTRLPISTGGPPIDVHVLACGHVEPIVNPVPVRHRRCIGCAAGRPRQVQPWRFRR